MKFEIIEKENNNIQFNSYDNCRIELFDLYRGECIRVIFVNEYQLVNINLTGIDRLHVINDQLCIYDYDHKNGLNKLICNFKPDFSLPFVCLTGHSGGGTSIVAKSLKFLGFHLGDDSGYFEKRKTHESISFRNFKNQILTQNEPKITDSFSNVLKAYNYKENNINIFKLPDLEKYENLANGIGLSKIFNDIKFVSVVKNRKSHGSTSQGNDFNSKNEFEIYKQQHPKVQAPMFHLDFDKYFSDHEYVNELLKFIGSNITLSKGDLINMKNCIEYEKK